LRGLGEAQPVGGTEIFPVTGRPEEHQAFVTRLAHGFHR
jgi:hypothetical protein